MDRTAFDAIVNATIAGLPQQFRDAVRDVPVVIKDRPVGKRNRRLLGLYEGVPITEWGRDYDGKLPDTITLYQLNIEEYAESPEAVPHVIRETLLHEIAHHFGLDHGRIGPMERRWKKSRKRSEHS